MQSGQTTGGVGRAVARLESVLLSNPKDLTLARKYLSDLLLHFGSAELDDPLDQLLSKIASNTAQPDCVSVLLRAIAFPELVPEPSKVNQIQRHVTSACERLHPDFLSFLRVDKSAQTYEKYHSLAGFHARVAGLLSPLSDTYGDLSSLLSAHKEVVGALNHSVVRSYCSPFFVNQARSSVESVLARLRQVGSLSSSLLADIRLFSDAVQQAREDLAEKRSFVTALVVEQFLPMCQKLLDDFLALQRSRFSCVIRSDSPDTLSKRYPLSETSRLVTIDIPLRNTGPGVATNVTVTAVISSDDLLLDAETANVGNVSPGRFSVSFRVMIARPVKSFDVLLDIRWGEIATSEQKSIMPTFKVLAQRHDIDWPSWEFANPYNTDVAEGAQFVGREDRVRALSSKFLSRPMESVYITGQKRIGKTSLALAAARRAQEQSQGQVRTLYLLWGTVAHSDPIVSLKQLGQQIDRPVRERLPVKTIADPALYDGSLAPLVGLFDLLAESSPDERFVIILDEFDEIHPELFLSGNIADTFFANLRALSRCKNVCLVLIGGENMPFVMERQGQKLNNFVRIDLSYFSRDTEWSDYQLMVRLPTDSLLTWHDEAISHVFNLTNGNPYFTKLICAFVLRQSYNEHDCDITSAEVQSSASRNLGSLGANSFAHLWQDGIPKRPDERELDVTRRLRVLVAIARCVRRGMSGTLENIVANRPIATMVADEITPVLDDFVRRKVLTESEQGYSFVLPIFQLWLADIGLSQLIANSVGEQLASAALERENSAVVTSAEVSGLAKTWTTYRGRVVGSEDIRAWLQQTESVFDQRILFKLLQRTLVVGEPFIGERLRMAHSMVRRSLPEFIIRKKGDRRRDLIVTYIDGEGKSGAYYASVYAEENGISSNAILSPSDFSKRLSDYIESNGEAKAVVIIDDVAATGQSLATNLVAFVKYNRDALENLAIRIVTLFSTPTAEPVINSAIQSLQHRDCEYRTCQILPERNYAFPENEAVWDSTEQADRAKALVTDIGAEIYRANPLGFGNLGLLLVLPNTVPNNTLPILHTPSRGSAKKTWEPLFPRIVN